MLELAVEELGRDDTAALLVTGFSVRALGRSGFVVSPSFDGFDGSAATASLLVAGGVLSSVVAGAAFASLALGAGFVSAVRASAVRASAVRASAGGSSSTDPGFTTMGAGTPISVAETERAAGAAVFGERGGLLALSARAGGRLVGRGGVDEGLRGKVLG